MPSVIIDRWSHQELLQLRALVETSLTAFFVGFLPGLVYLALASDAVA